MHPTQAQAHIDAWQAAQDREEIRAGALLFTIAQWSGNVRKGVKLNIVDFLPINCRKYATKKQTTPEQIEKMFSDFLTPKKPNG